MSRRRSRVYILVGLVLVFGPVIWFSYGSERQIAGMALGLAAIIGLWSMILSVSLGKRIDSIGADVRRIADALAPIEPPPTRDELDLVTVEASESERT